VGRSQRRRQGRRRTRIAPASCRFFGELQRTVLTDEVLDYTIREVTWQLRARQKDSVDDIGAMQLRKRAIEQELTRLAAAIAESDHSRFVLDAMAVRERELDQLAERLRVATRGNVERHPGSIRDFVKTRLSDLLGLLHTDTVRARAELAKHTAEIRMVPEMANSATWLRAAGV
jgi:hypothetical protein